MSSSPDNSCGPVDNNMNRDKPDDDISIPTEALTPYIESPELVKKMLKDDYGLTALQLDPLNGYDDKNYLVLAAPDHANPHIDTISPHGYFLKVSSLQDSRRPQLLRAQMSLMEHLAKKGIVVQKAIKTISGDVFGQITAANKDGDDVTYTVSLRSFLPGQIVAKVPLTSSLLYNMGRYVAGVSKALEDFHHSYYDTFDCLWSLNNLPKVAEVTFAVKDEKMKKIAEEVIEEFKTKVLPRRASFRAGQIHGDLNEQNILVTKESSPDVTPQICGLLDFQDSAYSNPLYDFALNVAYMLMTQTLKVPVVDTPGHMLAGYTSLMELPPAERAVFKLCVAARMVQSLVLGAYTFHMDPSNVYVLETSKTGWRALEELWEADRDQLEQQWDGIVKSYQ